MFLRNGKNTQRNVTRPKTTRQKVTRPRFIRPRFIRPHKEVIIAKYKVYLEKGKYKEGHPLSLEGYYARYHA